jgi:hypothetical protein
LKVLEKQGLVRKVSYGNYTLTARGLEEATRRDIKVGSKALRYKKPQHGERPVTEEERAKFLEEHDIAIELSPNGKGAIVKSRSGKRLRRKTLKAVESFLEKDRGLQIWAVPAEYLPAKDFEEATRPAEGQLPPRQHKRTILTRAAEAWFGAMERIGPKHRNR